MTKKVLIFTSIGIAIVLSTAMSTYLLHRESSLSSKPNIIVVSACSLRWDRIGFNNPAVRLTPKIDSWAKNSYVMKNAIAERPWQNFFYEANDIVTLSSWKKNGYDTFPERDKRNRFNIPPFSLNETGEEWYWAENDILHYQASLSELREALLRKKGSSEPFYAFVHLKYMHYPHFDSINFEEKEVAKNLSPKSFELLNRYRQDRANFDVQLPLIEFLFNDFSLLKSKFKINKDIRSAAGVISDKALADRWKLAESYQGDLKLASELYDLKIRKFDDIASEVLNLFGDRDLQKNTIVIFTGDHGEALMEHGVLGHSVNLYEEMLRYPLAIKFPRQSEGAAFEGQVNHRIISEMTKGMAKGLLNVNNFPQRIKAKAADYVMARNCANSSRAVRYRSEWKFISNVDSGRNELYNLLQDPQERQNVIESNPEMAWKLEEYLIANQKDLLAPNRQELKAKVCLTN